MPLRRQVLVFVLLAAYAGTGPLVDLIHRDAPSPFFVPIAAVGTHGCGEKEKHIPIGAIHQCAFCAQSNQRLAVPVFPPVPASPTLLCTGRVVHATHRTAGPLLAPSHPRGPPAT